MAHRQVANFAKDVVYLFQFAGTPTVSSLSPYCVKVEAFCRLHNLKFERRNTPSLRGANGFLPFIELNGVQTCESQVILRTLTNHFQLKNYADAQTEGFAHTIERMIENHTAHLLRHDSDRVLPELAKLFVKGRAPGFAQPAVISIGGYFMRRETRGVVQTAIGKYSDAEYDELLRNDLLQLQNILGDKQFLLGDTPAQVDCIVLAHLGSAYYRLPHARSHVHELIDSTELSKLKSYLERVVTRIFVGSFNDQ